jgi:hypothetical protein
MNTNLRKHLKNIIREELHNIIREDGKVIGRVLDTTNFDPVDPEVHVQGFGTMTRSALRMDIAKRLISLAKTAKQAASGTDSSYDKFKVLKTELGASSQIMQLITAEIEIAEELESLRSKGGRRTTPIPKQL